MEILNGCCEIQACNQNRPQAPRVHFKGPVKRPGAEDPYNSVRQSEDNFGGEVYQYAERCWVY